MKLLIISDIHNDVENIVGLTRKASKLDFDVIICPGDITDYNVPEGFSQKDIAKIIIENLKSLGKPVLMLPGNLDTYEVIEVLEKEGVSLHGKGRIIDDYGFYGYGGAKTPFKTPLEPSEEELKTMLEKAYEEVKDAKYKIQVTHAPPYNTLVDKISAGLHVGSKVVREFIVEKKPILAISAHIHEARGIDKINDTVLINSGRFPEGFCGLVNIENGKVDAKIINLSSV